MLEFYDYVRHSDVLPGHLDNNLRAVTLVHVCACCVEIGLVIKVLVNQIKLVQSFFFF